MQTKRREFLRRSLLAISAAAAGAAVTKGVSAAANGAMQHPEPGASSGTPPSTKPALTPEGKLIQVPANTLAHAHDALPASDPRIRVGVPGRKWVMVIDLARCEGCKTCCAVCQKMHATPPDREWIRVFQMRDSETTAPYYFPKPCFHCDNPPCTKVCPVGATFKRQDGIVLIDNERCIGCRFCIAACPYSTRYFNWGKPDRGMVTASDRYSPETGYPRRIGTAEKCDFCPEMAAKGKLPMCVTGCAMGAMYYGDQNEDAVTNSKGETERLTKLLKDRAGYRYMEELGTEPRVYYLPPKNRLYPAPGESTKA